jgi:hypothetical protein
MSAVSFRLLFASDCEWPRRLSASVVNSQTAAPAVAAIPSFLGGEMGAAPEGEAATPCSSSTGCLLEKKKRRQSSHGAKDGSEEWQSQMWSASLANPGARGVAFVWPVGPIRSGSDIQSSVSVRSDGGSERRPRLVHKQQCARQFQFADGKIRVRRLHAKQLWASTNGRPH